MLLILMAVCCIVGKYPRQQPAIPAATAISPTKTPHAFETATYQAALDKRLRYAKTTLFGADKLMREAADSYRYTESDNIRHISDVLKSLAHQVQEIEGDLKILRQDAIQRSQSPPSP